MQSIKTFIYNIYLSLAGIYFTFIKKVYKNFGVTLHVPKQLTDYKFRGRFTLDKYETEESNYLPKHLSSNAKVLELGACLGYVSCLTNNLLKAPDQHVVLEANPNLIEWLEKNKKENGCKFKIENSIISTSVKNTFYIHDLIVGGSTKRATGTHVDVQGLSFEDISKKHNIDFDTLIMDIEGGELDLFRNFKNDLKKFQMIFMEIHPFNNILTIEEGLECEQILLECEFMKILVDGNFQIWKNKNTIA